MSWIHVLRALVGLLFFAAGAMKLIGAENSIALFEHLGLPAWMVGAVGVTEIACAILLFVPAGFFVAIAGMLALMLGATISLVLAGEVPTAPVISAALVLVLWRWQSTE